MVWMQQEKIHTEAKWLANNKGIQKILFKWVSRPTSGHETLVGVAGLHCCFKLNLVPWKALPHTLILSSTIQYHPRPSTDTRSLHPAIFFGTIIASPCFSPKQELQVNSFTASARHWNQRNPWVSQVLGRNSKKVKLVGYNLNIIGKLDYSCSLIKQVIPWFIYDIWHALFIFYHI